MDNEEVSKIKKDIEKSGFPLEIEVGTFLRKNNWQVSHQTYFYDTEERKSRALDIFAARLELIGSPKLDRLNVTLLIECKRSLDKPWVFYTTQKEENHVADIGSLFYIKFISLPELEPKNYRLFWRSHYFFEELSKIATISYEPFSEGKKKRIFTATNQVLKALVYKRKTTKELLKKIPSILKSIVTIYYPLIIFDGKMYECELSDNDIEVRPVSYVLYQVSHGASKEIGHEETYLVDVITKEFLVTYLSYLNKEIEKMVLFAKTDN